MMNISKKDIQNFEKKFQKTEGCWEWMGAKNKWGYGIFTTKKTFRAHRFSHLLYLGRISSKKSVCHICDVPSCVNPQHLFLGTHTDNMRDKIKKGRAKGHSTLTPEKVLSLRKEYKDEGFTQKQLAEKYQITQGNVSNILKNRIWKHIKI